MLRFLRRTLVALLILAAVAATAPLWAMVLHGIFAQPRQADLIVVPGAALRNGGSSLSDALRWRMDTAIQLWRDGYAPVIMLSGGGEGNWNEPRAMARYAIEHGVPESALVLDHNGGTSRATARNVGRLLCAEAGEPEIVSTAPDLSKISGRRQFGVGDAAVDWLGQKLDAVTREKPTALVVSQWCHVPRLRVALQHEGVRAYGTASRHPQFLHNEVRMVMREAVGLWAYSLGLEDQVRDMLAGDG